VKAHGLVWGAALGLALALPALADSNAAYKECREFEQEIKLKPDGSISEGCGGPGEIPCVEGLLSPLGVWLVSCAQFSDSKTTDDCRAELESRRRRCAAVVKTSGYQAYRKSMDARPGQLLDEAEAALTRGDEFLKTKDIDAWEQELRFAELALRRYRAIPDSSVMAGAFSPEKRYEDVIETRRTELVRWRQGWEQTIIRNLTPRLDSALADSMKACSKSDWKTCEARAKEGLDRVNQLARLLPKRFAAVETAFIKKTGASFKMRLRLFRELARIKGTGVFWVNTNKSRVKLKFEDGKQLGTWKFPIKKSEGPFQIGQLVAASWRMADGEKRWYLAEVAQVSGDEVSVEYVDGDTGVRPAGEVRHLVRSAYLKPGQRVFGTRSNGARLYPGSVLRSGQLAAIVRWDDGTATSSVRSGELFR
jgi:hypothetical protein